VIESYKAKEQSYQERLEAAEITRTKAARGEAFGSLSLCPHVNLFQNQGTARRTLVDVEKLQTEAVTERQITHDRLRAAELRLRELEAKLEQEGCESSETTVLRQHLAEELEDERGRQKDLAERDFTIDQTRKKHQGMFCG
jgi:myosin protein heavy chain